MWVPSFLDVNSSASSVYPISMIDGESGDGSASYGGFP